jgi:hypothetical protein
LGDVKPDSLVDEWKSKGEVAHLLSPDTQVRILPVCFSK